MTISKPIAPPTPKPLPSRRWLVLGGLAAALGIGLLGGWGWWKSLWRPANPQPRPTWFEVPRGASLKQVARRLETVGLLRHRWTLLWLGRLRRKAHRIQAGLYLLSPHQTPQEILETLVEGKVPQVRITFPEGWTLRQMAARLEAQRLGSKERFLEWATQRATTFQVPYLPPGHSLEGYLFPDTYLIPLTLDERGLIERMLRRFQEVIAPLLPAIQQSGRTVHQIVTMASLVEREAKVPEERSLIAGVLYNRLERGMLLQCDATLQYALGEHQERILYRHLTVDSPYNTYKYPGLPPGPIANPGRASLEAAVHPAATDFLYYVARPDGRHVFSRTYEEHRQAMRRLRRGS